MRATITGLLVEAQHVPAKGDKPASIRGAFLIRGEADVRSELVRFYGPVNEETGALTAASEMTPFTLEVDVKASKSQYGDGVSTSVKVIRCTDRGAARTAAKGA